jgi:hypothetical protein
MITQTELDNLTLEQISIIADETEDVIGLHFAPGWYRGSQANYYYAVVDQFKKLLINLNLYEHNQST